MDQRHHLAAGSRMLKREHQRGGRTEFFKGFTGVNKTAEEFARSSDQRGQQPATWHPGLSTGQTATKGIGGDSGEDSAAGCATVGPGVPKIKVEGS